MKIMAIAAICICSARCLAQTAAGSSTPADTDAGNHGIEIVVGADKDLASKSIQISLVVKNNTKEALCFANDESLGGIGINLLALDQLKKSKTIYPIPGKNRDQMDAWLISIPPGESAKFPLAQRIPMDILDANYSGYVICIYSVTAAKTIVPLYSKPFSITAVAPK